MARSDWIKPNVQQFLTQVQNTVNAVTPVLASYGLVAGDLTPISSELSGLAFLISDQEAKADAAKAATEAGDAKRALIEGRYRTLNNKVQANPAVTPALKQAAGFPVKEERSPVPPPSEPPVVLIEESQRLLHRLRA